MENRNMNPLNQTERIIIVDVLRGWALLGVVIINYYLFFYLWGSASIPKDDYLSHIMKLLTDMIFRNKSRILLNILFGFGFSILISRLVLRGQNVVSFFSRRMFWLFVIGIVNSCFYYGDFLKEYAIIGMLMLPFRKATAKQTLVFAIALLLIYPISTHYLGNLYSLDFGADIKLYESSNILHVFWYGLKEGAKAVYEPSRLFGADIFALGCFLIGQFLHKYDCFTKILNGTLSIKKVLLFSVIAVLLLFFPNAPKNVIKTDFFTKFNIQFWFELAFVFVMMSCLCWLYKAQKLKKFFIALQNTGKMTLTNYMIQNLVSVLLFSGFGFNLRNSLPFYAYVLIAISVYILGIYFSKYWLGKYNYGPVEWIWRQLTYMKKLPLRKI